MQEKKYQKRVNENGGIRRERNLKREEAFKMRSELVQDASRISKRRQRETEMMKKKIQQQTALSQLFGVGYTNPVPPFRSV